MKFILREVNLTNPLFSIVIANYNYGRFLEEAILSVASQGVADKVELIVCDAASTDNSVDIIKKYEKYISWWCSEPDGGQSAAFNKGFSHARGRFLTWLNADDVLLPGTLKQLERKAKEFPSCEWFVGGCFWLDPQMRIINCGRGRPFSEIRYEEGNVSAWGPSSFFTKHLLDQVGGVDERFHYAMDSDLWLRFAYKAKARYKPFCKYAWGLRLHPDAKMSGHNFVGGTFDDKRSNEEKIVANKHYAQLKYEGELMKSYFKPKDSTLLSRIISVSAFNVIAAKIDLLRFRNRHYLEYFK